MTVPTTTARVAYAGNGVTVTFTVPWYFLSASDLKVLLRSNAGTEIPLTLATHYSVSGVGSPSGGSITLATPPDTGVTLHIIRDPIIVQGTDYLPNDPFPAQSHENALDLLTMVAQRLDDRLDRALVLAETDTPGSGAYQAGQNRVTNMAPAILDSDAVTLLQVQALITTAGVGGGGVGGGGGGGTSIVVPDSEIDRIIALTVIDPSLTSLFDPLNASVGNLSAQILALNGSIGSINTSIGTITVSMVDMQAEIDALSAISGDPNNIIALITTETTARIDGDDAIASIITKIGAAAGDNVSFILNMDTVKISATETIGDRFSGIATQFGTVTASVSAESTARSNADSSIAQTIAKIGALNGGGTAFIINLNTAYVGASESLAQRFSGITASLNTNAAAISTEQSTRANADASMASSITTLQSTVGSHTTSIQTQATTINGIQAKYSVKIDNNGNVAGFDLISTPNLAGGTVSKFKILATAFEVWNGASSVPAFSVVGGVVYMQNVVVGTGVLEDQSVTASALYQVSGTWSGDTMAPTQFAWYDMTMTGLNARVTLAGIPTSGTGRRVVLAVSMNAQRGGSVGDRVVYRVVRVEDGIVVKPTTVGTVYPSAWDTTFGWNFIDDAPTQASHTYKVQMYRDGDGGAIYHDVQILATVYKK